VPTYEYQCKSCKAIYELRQGFDAETTHKCEECHKGTAKRVLHAPPVVFKGGGWYATDSRGKSSAVSDAESKPDSDSKSSDAKSSDSKESKSTESTTKKSETSSSSTSESAAAS
jgi:putative FmdB family regulatory protein